MDKDDNKDEAADVHYLTLQGGAMSEAEAAVLENQVAEDPFDIDARVQLLGYYFLKSRGSQALWKRRTEHLKWMIENRAEHEVSGLPYVDFSPLEDQDVYAYLKKCWQKHIELDPRNTSILGNAATFLLIYDSKLAEEYLLRAREVEPTSVCWSKELAQLYRLRPSPTSQERSKALAEMERALSLENNETSRFYLKTQLVGMAFTAGAFDQARQVSEELLFLAANLRDDWNYGNAINQANTTLGRLALNDGDKEKAKKHLIESARDAWSPQTATFGPDMHLAAALLRAGEREVVLKYLDECETFWESGQSNLKLWRERIANDEFPVSWLADLD